MGITKIEWTDFTFNPWVGCSKVHAGCTNCYAETLMDTRYKRVKWGPKGTRSKTSAKNWALPVKWNAQAKATGVRLKVFCASLADIFEDRPELESWRAELFELIDNTPYLDWQILTKRPENIQNMWMLPKQHAGKLGGPWNYRANVWLGTSPCDQKTADESIPLLTESKSLCAKLFLSAEPLIGSLDLDKYLRRESIPCPDGLPGCEAIHLSEPPVDWVILGGESGAGARKCDAQWIMACIAQCVRYNVPVFVKQLGENPWDGDNRIVGLDKKGTDWDLWPSSCQDLKVREFP